MCDKIENGGNKIIGLKIYHFIKSITFRVVIITDFILFYPFDVHNHFSSTFSYHNDINETTE